jgi:hypothetical protein
MILVNVIIFAVALFVSILPPIIRSRRIDYELQAKADALSKLLEMERTQIRRDIEAIRARKGVEGE